jgi:Cu/Zn superoxide dismutase
MKLNNLVLVLFATACGSKAPPQITPSSALPPVPQEPPQELIANPLPALAETPEPTPPPPKLYAAQVELAPVRGAKLKAPVVVKFQQQEGKSALATADTTLDGLRAGTYYLVVHEATECGTNGTKAGKIWEPAAALPLTLAVTKDEPAKIDGTDVAFSLDGDQAITGRTLVLHEDNKGKPGRIVACGTVQKVEIPEQSADMQPTP